MTLWFRLTVSAPDFDVHKVMRVLVEKRWDAHVQPSFGVEGGEIHPGAIVTLHGDPLPTIAEAVTTLRQNACGFGCAFVETSDGRSGCSETLSRQQDGNK